MIKFLDNLAIYTCAYLVAQLMYWLATQDIKKENKQLKKKLQELEKMEK